MAKLTLEERFLNSDHSNIGGEIKEKKRLEEKKLPDIKDPKETIPLEEMKIPDIIIKENENLLEETKTPDPVIKDVSESKLANMKLPDININF